MKVCAGHTWRHEEIVVEDKESCPLCYELDNVSDLKQEIKNLERKISQLEDEITKLEYERDK